ncbi:NAD(P)/FAD-dependent oxidoreductase [Nicoliella spurrieriana]|uniref:NAD(P)/FAD-dependent oxidoreductase n=1 Tax=Nicoliella spurrieriana TaxID=2925830 RepID=A0A976X660_9LACO|nr:NAD(P)/FAD-dependent oxidoreductase [Nicoliella spurrieriana]UQS87271.1 NAD(P)/FAD-dependent oxidoreductase [Nicoliella spurrieriana]
MKQYDVIFIGSGHATWHGATKLAAAGKKVALVEGDTLFGTCTNYGCNAKMLLDGPADLIHQTHAYQQTGLTGEVKIDWPSLMKFKHQVLDADPDHHSIREAFPKMGIDIIDGWGQISDAHHVKVGPDEYETDYIVIGSGLRPAKLEIPGKEFLHDSREFLDIPEMPKHLTFIGGGFISYEFADLARAAGAEVDIISHSDRPLRSFYSKYVQKLTHQLADRGINFEFNQSVTSVTKTDDGLVVKTDTGNEIKTDYVLDATGRIANYEQLGLEALGIEADSNGITVDDHLRTSVPNIFASGDVVKKSQPKLTPTAAYESNYIAKLLLGKTDQALSYPPIAEIIFALPRLSQVGVKVDAVKNDDQYQIKRIPYGRVVFETKNEPTAEATVVLNAKNEIVGATVLGNQAGPLANLLSVIISKHMTPDDVNNDMIMAFPDESFGLFQMLSGELPG